MRIRNIIMAVALLVIGTTGHASEQQTPIWISAGLGLGFTAGGSGIGAAKGLSLTIKPGWLIFSLRYQDIDKDALNFDPLDNVHPHETVSDLGIMIGTASVKPNGETASIAIGIGSVTRVWQGEPIPDDRWFHATFEKKTADATGLCLQFEVFGSGWLGFCVYANINDIESFGGFMLCGRIGSYK